MTTVTANSKLLPRVAPPRPAAPQSTLSVKDIWGIIRRHLVLILVVLTLSILVAAGAYFLMRLYFPQYTADSQIEVKMPGRPNVLSSTPQYLNDRIIELEVAKQASFLRSDSFLMAVLQRMPVQDTEWYTSRKEGQRLEDLRKDFSASPLRDTPLVMVRFTTSNRNEAKAILDEVLSEFKNQTSQLATAGIESNLRALVDELTRTNTDLITKQRNMAGLARIAPGYESGRSVKLEELRLLDQERVKLDAIIFENKSQLQQLENQGGMSSDVMAYIERDPQINGIQNRITGLKEELYKLLESQGMQHTEVRGVQSRIQSLEAQMEERRNSLMSQASEYQQKNLELTIKLLEERHTDIASRIGNATRDQQVIDEQMAQYQNLREDIILLQQRAKPVQESINNMNVLKNDITTMLPDVRSQPIVPQEMSAPKLVIFLPAGIFLGLLLALGLTFLLEFLDDSLKSPVDVVRHLSAPSLGMIPLFEDEDEAADGATVETISATRPQALVSEYFRQFRTDLAFSAPESELRTILVTSAAADCGKTTVAANLALSMAQEGKRVLLVDGNFRRPRLHKIFPVDTAGQRKGLSNLLVGQALVQEAIRGTMIPGLDVVDSGPLPPNPTHLLSSAGMLSFLAKARENYHCVIIDGPPALLITDARILASEVDGTVIVVRAQETSRGVVQRLLRELRTPNSRVLGVLLNAVRPRRGGYYRDNYRSYYDYIGAGADGAPAAVAPQESAVK